MAMNKQLNAYIFIGRSGCGKGTQAEVLMNELKANGQLGENRLFYIETGDKFREFIKGTNYSNRLSQTVMSLGRRQPDFLAIWNWAHILIENLIGNEWLVFDGTPRSLIEAKVLDTAFNFYGYNQKHIFYIDVSREETKKRLLARGRADDTSADIDKRLDWFDNDVLPAVEYYEQNQEYFFHRLNGEQEVEKVSQDLLASLKV